MGAIQGAINQAVGSIAGAALGIKHTYEQGVANKEASLANKEASLANVRSKEHSALIAKGQATEALIQGAKAAEENINIGPEIHNKETELSHMEDIFERNGFKGQGANDIMEARVALKALQLKYRANKELIERATAMREFAAETSKAAEEANAKYEKKYGGRK